MKGKDESLILNIKKEKGVSDLLGTAVPFSRGRSKVLPIGVFLSKRSNT